MKKSLLFITLLLFAIVFTIPTFLSTPFGNTLLNRFTPKGVSFEKSKLSWFRGLRIENVRVVRPEGTFHAKAVETEDSLLRLLLFKSSWNSLKVEKLEGQYQTVSIASTDIDVDRALYKIIVTGAVESSQKLHPFSLLFDQEKQLHAEIDQMPAEVIDTLLKLSKHPLAGKTKEWMGPSLTLKMNSHYSDDLWNCAFEIASENIQGKGEGAFKDNALTINSPAQLSIQLTQALLDAFPQLNTLKELQIPSLKLQIDTLTFPLSTFPENAEGALIAGDNHFAFTVTPSKGAREVTVHLALPLRKESVEGTFRAKIATPGSFKELQTAFLFPKELELQFSKIPTAAIEKALKWRGALNTIFGPEISFSLSSSELIGHKISGTLSSEKVKMEGIELTLSSDLTDLEEISANVAITSTRFYEKRESAEVRELEASLFLENKGNNIYFSFKGTTIPAPKKQGFIVGEIEADNLHHINSSNLSVQCNGEQIPTKFLQMLTGRDELTPLFGDTVTLYVNGNLHHLNGEWQTKIQGEQGSGILSAELVDGTLILKKPFVLKTEGREQLGKEFLQRFSPAFSELLYSETPIVLTISDEGFSLPLHDFSFENMQIANASCNFGKLGFYNRGEIRNLIKILRPAKADVVTLWTTPLYFHVDRGRIDVERIDLLAANRFPIALWGEIDIPQDRIQMIIGITGDALTEALDLSGSVSIPMLQLPIKGKLSKAKIDTSQATTKIAAIIAQDRGGAQGQMLGTVLNLFNGKEERVPPPTTTPFPWEGERKRAIAEKQSKKKEKPVIPLLEKEIPKFFKNVFQ